MIARGVALAADLIQLSLFPYFGWGGILPLNAAFDVVTCAILWRLIGWHIAFLPSFVMELTPGLTIAPTWTIAVLIATRGQKPGEMTVDIPPISSEKPEKR